MQKLEENKKRKNDEHDHQTCLQLAVQGEQFCKEGNYEKGVILFHSAIQAGTDDINTLSVIYCQLGNAYFYLKDYEKAEQYHKLDLTLVRYLGDKSAEAKSVNNLGNTVKAMHKFDEAISWFQLYLNVSKDLLDKCGEGRAYYNLGNVYYTKGKEIEKLGHQLDECLKARENLQIAIEYYKKYLDLMIEMEDEAARGRALGNIGNAYYHLGEFEQAVHFHLQRLKIAEELGNKLSERRAHTNLGNCYVFLQQFNKALQHYSRTLVLAQELGDQTVVAQASYSLANTYTLLQDHAKAIELYLRHLLIMQQLGDKVGEGRACWSLSNAYLAAVDYEKALHFANLHFQISKTLDDLMGLRAAQRSIRKIQSILKNRKVFDNKTKLKNDPPRRNVKEMELMNANSKKQSEDVNSCTETSSQISEEFSEEHFSEQMSRLQLNCNSSTDCSLPRYKIQQEDDDLMEWIQKLQSKRMDEQRVSLPFLPGFGPK